MVDIDSVKPPTIDEVEETHVKLGPTAETHRARVTLQ
jgi:hypothetical protein